MEFGGSNGGLRRISIPNKMFVVSIEILSYHKSSTKIKNPSEMSHLPAYPDTYRSRCNDVAMRRLLTILRACQS